MGKMDLISRQDAINEVGQYISQFDAIDANFLDGLKTAINIVKKLPSVQPEITEDDVKEYCRKRCLIVVTSDFYDEIMSRWPSAQTEIIRCKDCKHFELNKKYVIQGIPVLGHEVCNAWGDGCKTSIDGFCFMAEKRGKKNEGD